MPQTLHREHLLAYRPRLLFTAANDWWAAGVKLWTVSPTSHVALVLGPRADMLLHAVDAGVVLESRELFYRRDKEHDIAEYVILPNVQLGLLHAMSLLGSQYDMREVVSYVALKVGRLVCPWLPKNRPTPGHWTCARFVMQLDPDGINIPEWKDVDSTTATPGGLLHSVGSSFAPLQ